MTGFAMHVHLRVLTFMTDSWLAALLRLVGMIGRDVVWWVCLGTSQRRYDSGQLSLFPFYSNASDATVTIQHYHAIL